MSRCPNGTSGLVPEAQLAETVRLAGVAASSLACVTGPPSAVDINPWAIPEGEGSGIARPVPAAAEPGAPTPAKALAARFQGAYPQFPRLLYVRERLPEDRVLYAREDRSLCAVTVHGSARSPRWWCAVFTSLLRACQLLRPWVSTSVRR